MSFVIGDDTYYEPSDFLTSQVELVDEVWCIRANGFRRVPISSFRLDGWIPEQILNSTGGNAHVTTQDDGKIIVEAKGLLQLFGNNTDEIRIKFVTRVATKPAGAGINMYADGFIEWSSEVFKEEIKDLDSEALLSLTPKEYKVQGKKTYGLLVEDLEPLIPDAIHSVFDEETGKTVKGWNVSSFCAHVLSILKRFLARFEDIEARLTALEAKEVTK